MTCLLWFFSNDLEKLFWVGSVEWFYVILRGLPSGFTSVNTWTIARHISSQAQECNVAQQYLGVNLRHTVVLAIKSLYQLFELSFSPFPTFTYFFWGEGFAKPNCNFDILLALNLGISPCKTQWRPYVMPGSKRRSAAYKASTLQAVLSLHFNITVVHLGIFGHIQLCLDLTPDSMQGSLLVGLWGW